MAHPRLLFYFAIPLLLYFLARHRARRRRRRRLPPNQERVLILGATSGIGRAIARLYAARGARICIIGRRQDRLESARAECEAARPLGGGHIILAVPADFTNPSSLVSLRETLQKEWQGLDTLIVNAGVSALQPLLAVAGAHSAQNGAEGPPLLPDLAGLTRLKDVSHAAIQGNFTGPLLSVAALVPFLAQTSSSPAVLLISTVAAVIPAPTRTLYAASKAASLVLFQALSIEQPKVTFTAVLPATVEGDFRASAVDGGIARENLSKSLTRDHVARECIRAVDAGSRTVWLPWSFRLAHLLYWLVPSLIDEGARRKYNFTPH